MSFENTLQYVTFADRTQVENRTDDYDTLLVTSHLLAGGQKAVPTLLKKIIEEKNVEYYVDPSSTEFRHGRNFRDSDGSLREWHSKLVDALGDPFEQLREEQQNFVFEDLSSDEQQEAVRAVCDFQDSFVKRLVEQEAGKYFEVLNMGDLGPRAIVPPYVLINDYGEVLINEEVIQLANRFSERQLKPCVHVTKGFIDGVDARKAIVESISGFDIPEVFIWIDGLSKTETTVDDYVNTIRLVGRFSKAGIDPHFLYGDFFSNLLYYFGLRGTSYGTYYRESNSEEWGQGGGSGGTLQRFYFDPVKDFLSIPDTIALAQQRGEQLPNHGMLNTWESLFEAGEDHDFLKNHYIKTRKEHKRNVQSEDIGEQMEEITRQNRRYGQLLLDVGTNKDADHLRKWHGSILQFESEYNNEYEELIEMTRQLPATSW